MKRLFVGLIVVGGLLAAGRGAARGDVFLLTNGGRVEGQWLNRDEPQRQNYQIRLSSGGQLTLDNAQVKKVVERGPTSLNMTRSARSIPTRPTGNGNWPSGVRSISFRPSGRPTCCGPSSWIPTTPRPAMPWATVRSTASG